MPTLDRWPKEMQDIQSAIAWLVPDVETARNLVSEAQIPPGFIDFGEPLWNRIKRIMVEAEKREMMPQLLAVITSWYSENKDLAEAKLAWEAGEDRKAAAAALRRAAKEIQEPTAVARVTRKDNVVTDVEVEVNIPHEEDDVENVLEIPLDPAKKTTPKHTAAAPVEMFAEIQYSDEMTPGDWFSVQKTLADQERRLLQLERWRQQLSIMPTPGPVEGAEE